MNIVTHLQGRGAPRFPRPGLILRAPRLGWKKLLNPSVFAELQRSAETDPISETEEEFWGDEVTFSSKVTPLESLVHDDSDKNESQFRFLNSQASFALLSYHALFKMSGHTVLQSGTKHWCAARLGEIHPRRL